MKKWGIRRYAELILLAVVIAGSGFSVALAETSKSTNYQTTETQFGASSTQENCSSQYCSRVSIGDVASGGNGTSSGSTATFGPITSDQPTLDVIVDPGQSDLGKLDTEHTATKTMIVRIRSYLSNGYTLQITGTPPKYGNHTLATPTTPTAASPGTEQFAINAVANTSPNVGAGPVQVPDDQTSFGEVNDNYKTANLFKYVSGDVVAHSAKSSGQTDFTISMIFNISNSTPAGRYTGDYSAVVIPVY
jgi:hypothetical protein